MENLRGLIDAIPKVELHVHIEGTLEPEQVFQFAARNNVELPYQTVDDLRKAYNFTSLDSFLKLYYEGCRVLQTEQDFYDMTWAYLTRAMVDSVVYLEMFFDPQSHTERGISFETVVNGITRALENAEKEYGIKSRLIMCFLRHLDVSSAADTLERALAYMRKVPQNRIVGVGLDSTEIENPPKKFKTVFDRAVAAGLRVTVHAGEEGPPQYIRDAIDFLGAERIDHGIRCLEDKTLVRRLVREEIPLTVCPLSNIKLCVFNRLEDHNLRDLLNAGLIVSVHSDDPAYFGGYIKDNYINITEALGLTMTEVITLAENAIKSTFLSEDEKAQLQDRLRTTVNSYQ